MSLLVTQKIVTHSSEQNQPIHDCDETSNAKTNGLLISNIKIRFISKNLKKEILQNCEKLTSIKLFLDLYCNSKKIQSEYTFKPENSTYFEKEDLRSKLKNLFAVLEAALPEDIGEDLSIECNFFLKQDLPEMGFKTLSASFNNQNISSFAPNKRYYSSKEIFDNVKRNVKFNCRNY